MDLTSMEIPHFFQSKINLQRWIFQLNCGVLLSKREVTNIGINTKMNVMLWLMGSNDSLNGMFSYEIKHATSILNFLAFDISGLKLGKSHHDGL